MISEADVDLHANDRSGELAIQHDAGALILVRLPDRIDFDARKVEVQTVVGFDRTDLLLKGFNYRRGVRIAVTQEIEIAGRSKDILWPGYEEHRSFENVAVAHIRLT